MVREVFITVYLSVFKLIFNFFNLFPLKEKVTFVVSFGDNSQYVYEEIREQKAPVEVVVLYKGSSDRYFRSKQGIKLIPLNLLNMFKSIYHLATSKYIFIDNYFGFLAVTDFKQEVECIQLWHASGAIKKFGLEDLSIKKRSNRAKKRFLQVYKKFHKVVVGSDVMAKTFIKAFDLSNDNILRTGIPRTDFFYNEVLHKNILDNLNKEVPEIKNKKRFFMLPPIETINWINLK